MGMVENLKKFYLYDRWFELEKKSPEELVYWSIPKTSTNKIKIKVNLKTKEMILFYFENKNLLKQINISDITKDNIELHYLDVACDLLEIGENKYDNLAIEIFTNIINSSVTRKYQLMFTKRDKESTYKWEEPLFPINEKLDLDEIDCSSPKVENFIEFACYFPIILKKLRPFIFKEQEITEDAKVSEARKLVIPQEIIVYDRVYHLVNNTEDKIFMTNTEEEIRNLEIKYDPASLLLKGISLKIKDKNKTERIIKIKPNSLDGVTVKYHTKIRETILINNQKMEAAKVHSDMIFDSNNQKYQTSVSISNDEENLYLLEHPVISNNYSDTNGDLYTIRNSGYNLYYGIASFAPGIVNGIKQKIFKKVDE